MTTHLRLLLPLLLALSLFGAACGSDDTVDVGSPGGDDADLPVDSDSGGTDSDSDADDSGDLPDPDTGGGSDVAAPMPFPDPEDGRVIGWANLGGAIIDPQPHPILGWEVAESYPEQIGITFEAGAEPCLAATATATATETEVVVSLQTGINEQALFTSCIAIVEKHRLMIALEEGLDGRELIVRTDG